MDDVKVVIIGAGSTVFTPGLIADLANSDHLHDATVALVDVKPAAVETMRRFAERVARERGAGLRVVAATDRREVLPGATFVTTTIAVGGAAAWERDLRIPERHGVHQTVGDSVGPGGVFRALRHVPELVAIARDMEGLCPDAWLFNYTNPLSALVRAVHKSSPIRCVGLCHGILHTRHVLARDLDIPTHELNVVAAGVNHLCWMLDLRHHGQDLYPRLRAKLRAELAAPSALYGDGAYDAFQQVSARLTALYGLYPSPGDRHVAEFFPYFLHGDGGQLPYGTQAGLDLTNEILSTKDTLWERITAQAEGTAPLDDDLFAETREGERVVSIMEAILCDQPLLELAVNLRNDGLIPRLPEWAVVEVPGLVSGYGVRGIGVAPLPQAIADILRARVHQQELIVDAALTGDRALALQALLADPLMPRLETAEAMLDEALAAHAQYLPQFSQAPASAPPRALSDAAA